MPTYSSLPVSVLGVPALVAARLTLPASTADETVKGSGRQVRQYRAPTFRDLAELVAREMREHALGILTTPSRGGSGRGRGGRAADVVDAAVGPTRREIAQSVLDALAAGDLQAAARLHADGFGLPVMLPPALGGTFGDLALLPTPRWASTPDRRKIVLEEDTEDDGAITGAAGAVESAPAHAADVTDAADAPEDALTLVADSSPAAATEPTPHAPARRVKRGLATAA